MCWSLINDCTSPHTKKSSHISLCLPTREKTIKIMEAAKWHFAFTDRPHPISHADLFLLKQTRICCHYLFLLFGLMKVFWSNFLDTQEDNYLPCSETAVALSSWHHGAHPQFVWGLVCTTKCSVFKWISILKIIETPTYSFSSGWLSHLETAHCRGDYHFFIERPDKKYFHILLRSRHIQKQNISQTNPNFVLLQSVIFVVTWVSALIQTYLSHTLH